MRSILVALFAAAALPANALHAQYTITATAEVIAASTSTPARVTVSAGRGVVRIQTVEGGAPARGLLERTYVTATAADMPRTMWVADERGPRLQHCDTAAAELRVLLRQRAIELPRADGQRIIVTKVVASNS